MKGGENRDDGGARGIYTVATFDGRADVYVDVDDDDHDDDEDNDVQ